MNGAQGGLLMILAAVVLFVLWNRGYLANWIGQVTNNLSGTTTAKPINLLGGIAAGKQPNPLDSPSLTTAPGTRRGSNR